MLQYKSYLDSNSLYNTISTFPVYFISLVTQWLIEQGGITAIQQHNETKAGPYDYIDNSDYYYSP